MSPEQLSLSFPPPCFIFLPSFCVPSIQLTTPPYFYFYVTHFTHKSSSTQQAAKFVCGVSRSYRSVWCESGFLTDFIPGFSRVYVLLFQSYTLDSCSLYCLTSFLPHRSPWGPGSCYLNVFLQVSDRGGWVEREREKMGAGEWEIDF